MRQKLSELEPDLTVQRLFDFGEQVSEAMNFEPLLARLTTEFGILALTLASIGLYGVTAYTVERRTREIGLRVAVGANRTNFLSMVLRGALRHVAIGLALGIPLALLSGWLISSQLFEVTGHDPVALVLAAIMLTAARRAASIPYRR